MHSAQHEPCRGEFQVVPTWGPNASCLCAGAVRERSVRRWWWVGGLSTESPPPGTPGYPCSVFPTLFPRIAHLIAPVNTQARATSVPWICLGTSRGSKGTQRGPRGPWEPPGRPPEARLGLAPLQGEAGEPRCGPASARFNLLEAWARNPLMRSDEGRATGRGARAHPRRLPSARERPDQSSRMTFSAPLSASCGSTWW